MSIDWQQVGTGVRDAVLKVLGGSWQTVSSAAGPQLEAMVSVGASIEQSYSANRLTELEYKSLRSMEKNALEGILSSYEAVGIVVGEQAADAAWSVISQALLKAGVAFA
ncbi:MAG TPA: hypothetical protein VN754_01615 [Candidatus Binataceae bacterium]|nr:hypothetical protein [Candidatus Binataceae bacterium]